MTQARSTCTSKSTYPSYKEYVEFEKRRDKVLTWLAGAASLILFAGLLTFSYLRR